jgi:protein-disulfide isomerase
MAESIRSDFRSLLTWPLQTAVMAVVGTGLLAAAWFGGQHLQAWIAEARAARQVPQRPGVEPRPAKMLYVSQEDEQLEEHAWSRKTQDTPRDRACLDKEADARATSPLSVKFGTSAEGYHWKGAEHPAIEIHEFTDFQCPYCRNAHMLVNRLVSRYSGQLRVYHRHLPLDNRCNHKLGRPFHPRACELSRIAVCAGQQGRFWEMADYLFHNSQVIHSQNLPAEDIAKALALDLGKFNCCMDDPQAMRPIEADLAAAATLNLRGTPAYLIGGQVYYGKIPDEALRMLDGPAP